jgi:hypothetical protein
MSIPPQPDGFEQPPSPLSVPAEISSNHGAFDHPRSFLGLKKKFDPHQDKATPDDEEDNRAESGASSIVQEQSSLNEKKISRTKEDSIVVGELNEATDDGDQQQPPMDLSIDNRVFKYKPLNLSTSSIRLLRIHPGLHIRCTLHHATVDENYTCLSYVWGPPDAGHVILLDGRIHRVRRNLLDFLKMARTRHADKLLWIDALCIDQENIIERNHQVQQMGEIFARARNVLAWLGSDAIIEKQLAEVSG